MQLIIVGSGTHRTTLYINVFIIFFTPDFWIYNTGYIFPCMSYNNRCEYNFLVKKEYLIGRWELILDGFMIVIFIFFSSLIFMIKNITPFTLKIWKLQRERS